MLAIAAGMFVPFIWMVLSSFKPYQEILSLKPTLWPKGFTVGNYTTLTGELPFLRYFLNSAGVSSVVTLVILFTSSLCGYVFAKFDFAFKELIFMTIISSMMVPFAVVVLPLYFLIARLGMLDTYLGLVVPFMVNAFGIFLMRQFMEGIPRDLVRCRARGRRPAKCGSIGELCSLFPSMRSPPWASLSFSGPGTLCGGRS